MTRPDGDGTTHLDSSAAGRVATGTCSADSSTFATTVDLPLEPSGLTLAAVIREVRLAMRLSRSTWNFGGGLLRSGDVHEVILHDWSDIVGDLAVERGA